MLPQSALVPIPKTLSFEQAACLPVAGLAAWCALTSHVRLGPGRRVLVLGTGGLSTLGLQIAKTLGAEVAVVSSSDEKLGRVRQLGADFTAQLSGRDPGGHWYGDGAAEASTWSWTWGAKPPSTSR